MDSRPPPLGAPNPAMTVTSDKQGALFADLFAKPVRAVFDSRRTTSDGGSLLLKLCDRLLGGCSAPAAVLARSDQRQPAKTRHSAFDLIRQRVFAITLGYFHAIDVALPKSDPALKAPADRDPSAGPDLASQSTLSRFENSVRNGDLPHMAEAFADAVIDRWRRRGKTRLITIDVDPACDPTHGGQQPSLFNGFYDTSRYLPTA